MDADFFDSLSSDEDDGTAESAAQQQERESKKKKSTYVDPAKQKKKEAKGATTDKEVATANGVPADGSVTVGKKRRRERTRSRLLING